MTSERRFVIDLADVRTFEFICKTCLATVGLNPARPNIVIPSECPSCRQMWIADESVLHKAAYSFFRALQTFREFNAETKFEARITISESASDRASGGKD
jgi:hypothetical protein